MKKTIYYIIGIMLFALSACSGDDPVSGGKNEPTYQGLTLSPSTLSALSEESGSTTIKVKAGENWTAQVDQDWCTITPAKGNKGETEVTITVTANESYDERNTAITFSYGGETKRITVTQKQKDALLVTSSKLEFTAEGGDKTIEVKANVQYSVTFECEGDWLHKSSRSRALESTEVAITVDKNDSPETRTGKIIIKSGELSETVEVYQVGSPSELVLTESEFVVPAEGDTLKIELATNSKYSYTSPDVDWIEECESRVLSTYTHYFVVKENEGTESREATITFINEYTGDDHPVKITQVAPEALVLAKNEYRFDSKKQEWKLQVLANMEFDVQSDTDWLTIVESEGRGLTEKCITMELSKNVSKEARHATLTLTADNGTVQVIKVTQTGEQNLMRVAITHMETPFYLFDWTGKDVFGTVNWGEGTTVELSKGMGKEYSTADTRTVTVDLYNAETITIGKIGSISAITIYTNQGKKGAVEDVTIDKIEWD